MSNPVSELFIRLGLDAADFVKGLSDAEKQTKAIGETAKKTGDEIRRGLGYAFTDLVKAAFPLLGVVGTINALANAQQSLYKAQKASKEIGIPANEYAAWGRAAESLGFSAEDAQNSLVSLQASMQEAALTGRSAAAGVLTYLGVGLFKSNGQLKSATEIFKDLSRVLDKMPVERARAYGQMMGLSPSTIALLREGKDLSEELAKQLEIGPSKEDAERAWEVQKAWNQLKITGADVARNVFVTLYPVIEDVLIIAQKLSAFLAKNSDLVTYAGTAFLLTVALGKLATAFMAIGRAGAMAISLIGAAMKANPILAGITLIIAGIIDCINFFRGADSVIGAFFDMIGVKAESVKAIFRTLGEILLSVLTPFKWVIDGMMALFAKDNPPEIPENGMEADVQGDRSEKRPNQKLNANSARPARRENTGLFGQGGIVNSMVQNAPRQNAQSVQTPPSVVNKTNSARTVNSQVHNEVTINAPNGDAKTIQRATQSGIQGGMSGYDRSLITFQETGFISK